MAAAAFRGWCAAAKGAESNACVLRRVETSVPDEALLRGLSAVKTFGKVEIVSRNFDFKAGTDIVLVQTSEDITGAELREDIGVPGDAGPWRLQSVGEGGAKAQRAELPAEGAGDLRERILSVLEDEGKEWSDLEKLVSSRSTVKGESSELTSALTSLARRAEGPRQKIRVFSGITPTPEGEEEYETWVEQTSQLLRECQCSDEEKRQRLVESLRGEAAGVVRGVKLNQLLATLKDDMEALERAFGLTGSSSGSFKTCIRMRVRSPLRTFYRLERQLNGWPRRGVIRPEQVDQFRMDQVFRGTQAEDKIAWSLRQSYKTLPPPTFVQLIRDVRGDERALRPREDSVRRVRSSVVAPVGTEGNRAPPGN
ncbi:modulator of apoptosis 1-like [Hemitrygon akajei]|uniref:modulator of apoptosis 1-like n=1 Tax=Hemitrygon akajei TaxID=2704970 RepID=UPI003BF9CAF3